AQLVAEFDASADVHRLAVIADNVGLVGRHGPNRFSARWCRKGKAGDTSGYLTIQGPHRGLFQLSVNV
ncbi:hypothetical protein, partial [Mesorhizobium sp.]|uniref:hypothetical protein n=1 Tax=Mesorhizobium sp. TaxID=1871066 RepID=UPI00257D5E14